MSVWYRAGTVAVTNGSKTVTGTNTQWLNSMFGVMPGTTFYGPDGKPYEIDRVVSDTSLLLITNYSGTTASAQAYSIDPTRSGSVASLAAQTSEVLKFSQEQFTQMQTWVTGPANADVTLKAPSGQTVVVPSWKKISDTVEGQAAIAKQEADKAAASAALAGDTVAASALPLPDVWVPLNDSLRMITGYGRDVTVGGDVVARMVNFSRSTTATYIGKDGTLKTAAANEPRFEKDGLLLEGQSMNLFPWSQAFIGKWSRADGVLSPDVNFQSAIALNGSAMGYVHANVGNLPVGSAYTITAIVKGYEAGVTALRGVFANEAHETESVIGRYGAYTVLSFTRRSVSNINASVTGIAWDAGKATGIVLCAMQIEGLPFSSSYIPTNGSAVTRAADQLWIPAYGNEPFGLVMSVAAEVDILGKGLSSWPRPYELIDQENKGAMIDMGSGSWGGFGLVGVKTTIALRFSDLSYWAAGVKMSPKWPGYSDKIYTGNIYLFGTTNPARAFYGHVRNVRAWFSPLSDAQHKAIK